MYADVVFPLRLKTLTYKLSEDVREDVKGRIVSAPLNGRDQFGLVISINEHSGRGKDTKVIKEIHIPFSDETFISFLKWMGDYYLSSPGIALKSSFFSEVVDTIRGSRRKTLKKIRDTITHESSGHTKSQHGQIASIDAAGVNVLDELTASVMCNVYKTIPLRPVSWSQERVLIIALMRRLAESIDGTIILVPEISYITQLKELRDIFGGRLEVFHSKMTRAQKRIAAMRVLNGEADIVLGTRSAVFAPLKKVSMIVAIEEHSNSYKAEEGLRYNGRDLAVMLGYMHHCPVLLSSPSPSLETIHNIKAGRYSTPLILEGKRCRVKAVRHKFKEQLRRGISKELLLQARGVIDRGGTFLWIAQREGYSLIYCKDCGSVLRCEKCGISVVFFNNEKRLRCHNCGDEKSVANSCSKCAGFNLVPLGSGTERISSEIESFLNASTRIIKKSSEIGEGFESIIIGSKSISRHLSEGLIDSAAIIDFECFIHRYGYRSEERAFQEVIRLSGLINERGSLYIQANNTNTDLIRSLVRYDFDGFYNHELSMRHSAGYPPYKKLVALDIHLKDEMTQMGLMEHIEKGAVNDAVEILGPLLMKGRRKGFDWIWRFAFKSSNKRLLNETVSGFVSKLRGIKGIDLSIDVDPLAI